MYCTRCGKEITYDSPICVECAKAAEEKMQQEQIEQQLNCNDEIIEPKEEPEAQADTTQIPAYEILYSNVNQGANNTGSTLDSFAYTTPTATSNTRKAGLGKAITALITAFISSLLTIIGYAVIISSDLVTVVDENLMYTLGAVVAGFGVILGLLPIIFGVLSIKTFAKVKKQGNPPPVATLVIGLIALGTVLETLFVALNML